MASLRAFGATPIVGKAIAWNGQGDVPNYGIGAQNHWFLTDRVALGGGVNVIKFDTPGDNVLAGEVEGRLRYYLAEIKDVGFFWDLSGGYMLAHDNVPPDGTMWNYTFAFGPGAEIPLGEINSLLLGAEFHHMSNARGRDSARNPSQNEFLFWLGHSWVW